MMRHPVPRSAGILSILALLALGSARSAVAQGNVDIIAGRVTDAAGKPVLGATVEALSIETDVTRRATSNAKGDYIIFFNDGGGQYRVTVRAIGHTPFIVNVSRQNDDDRISLDIKMTEQATRVETLIAQGNRRPPSDQSTAPTPGSTERLITGDQAMRLPIDASDLAALAALAPGVIFTAGTDSTSATFSVAGQSAESNSYQINGAETSSTTVPQDAVRSTRVITNSYDVSRGGFAGGQVSVTTKGGSNRVSGSFSSQFQNQHLAWGEATDNPFTAGTTQNQVGGGYGGPLKRDKLFLFGSMQVRQNLAPLASLNLADPATLSRLGVAQDSVTEFINDVGALGLTAKAGNIDPNRTNTAWSSINRFDWNIGQVNILTMTANVGLSKSDPSRIGQTQLQQVGGNTDTHTGALSVQLVSHMGRWLNRALTSASVNDSKSDPFLFVPVGRVTNQSTLDSGRIAVSTFGFGGNSGLPNHQNTKSYQFTDELSFLPGLATHRFALGLQAIGQNNDQDVTNNRYGTYTFATLADFANNVPSQFTRTLQPTIRDGSIINEAVYLSDAWRPRSTTAGRGGRGGGGGGGGRGGRGGRGGGGGDIGTGSGPTGGNSNFQLIYGVRLEHTSYTGAPALNQAVLDEFHVRTDQLPSETYITPRIGFQYAIPSPEQQGQSQRGFAPTLLTIRGGVGIFRGAMPAGLPGTAQSQSGLSTAQQQLICVGSAVPIPNWTDFLNDPNSIPDECIDNQSTAPITGRPSVTTYDPDYGAPKTKRASLGLSRRVTTRITFNADASYVRGVGQAASRDLNLNETPKFQLGGMDHRPVYADPAQIVTTTGQIPLSASRIDANYGSVDRVFSALENETKQVTFNLSGTTSKQMQLNLSYTLMFARDMGGAGGGLGRGGGGGGGGGGNLTAGDPNLYEWATSSGDRRHNIQASLNWPVTPAFELTAQIGAVSGTHYTPTVNGDINGDGSRGNDRAFIYSAANAPDTAVASAMTRLLASTSGNARSCLEAQMNSIAGRNSCTGRWQPTLNLALNWRPNLFKRQLSVSFRPINLLGGLDELFHGANNLSGWGLTPRPDNTLLTVKGFDPNTNQFKYVVNERFGSTSAQTTATRTPFQLAIQLRYALGFDQRTQQIQSLGQRGFNPSQADAKTLVDTFLVRYRRQNAAQASLDRKDSLALLPAQITKLQALLDSSNKLLQPEIDTLVIETDKVKKAGTSADPVPLATRIRTFTAIAVREQNRVHDAVRVILDEVQWALLPEFVRNPLANLTGPTNGRGGAGGGRGGGGGGRGGGRGGGGD